MTSSAFILTIVGAFAPVAFMIGRKQQRTSERLEYERKIMAWRESWRDELAQAAWITKGSMTDVVKESPPPTAPTWMTTGSHGITEKVRCEIQAEFDNHNQAYEAAQKERLRVFFDTVEKNPLTEEQIAACICMDENIQIVAAAGSGKTSTMVAKAGYALHQNLAQPTEILLLAFNKDAAQELKERVRSRLAGTPGIEDVTARTFNAFGLSVIGEATGRKPSIPKWVTEPGEDGKMIARIIDDLSATDMGFALEWNLYRSVYARDIGPLGAPETPDAYEKGRFGYRAASGDLVKSLEELAIANWLFLNQIEFEYERRYEHDTVDRQHAQYRPDFYYPEIDLYHEHFALNADGQAPPHFESYVDGVEWKRQLHAEKGTKLFETQSHQMRSDVGLKALEAELRSHGLEPRPDGARKSKVPPLIDGAGMAKLVRTFQQHVKSNGLDEDRLRSLTREHADKGYSARINLFVSLYRKIADEWDRRLRDEEGVDFEDMLIMAAELIEQGRYRSPFVLVLADEFQDSSRARIRLLKALSSCRPDVTLCVVGDDWQGINRFAGADISVMTEFDQHFANATQLTLNTTFRCPQELCDASSEFVQINPVQIRKTVRTTNTRVGDALVCFGFRKRENAVLHLGQRIERLARTLREAQTDTDEAAERTSILILGRYRKNAPIDLAIWQRRFDDVLDIEFRTVHRSKGSEATYVVLLEVTESSKGYGFPSSREDDPIIQIPMPKPDPHPMAEERRLFYVALTRAKQQVWIYTELDRPSRFLKELADAGRLVIKPVDGAPVEQCPKCRTGALRIQNGPYGSFQSCGRFPACDFKRNLPASGSMVARPPKIAIVSPDRRGNSKG